MLKVQEKVHGKAGISADTNAGSNTKNNMDDSRELTYGEKAVGLTFNPSNDADVQDIKITYAAIIDKLNDKRNNSETTQEAKRLYSIAITEAQAAQMWAVKAITFPY